MPTLSGNRVVLEAALEGLQLRRAKLDEQIASVRSMLGGSRNRNSDGAAEQQPAKRRRKRRMSAEGRKRIADAARKRWAEYNAQKRRNAR